MSFQARIDIDVVYHETTEGTFALGSIDEHLRQNPTRCETVSDTLTTSAEPITTQALSTVSMLAIKNTGSSTIRLEGSIDISAGRLAVLPVTELPSVSAPSGSGSYSAVVFS